ncbi:hypothetical protein L228DRAFT_250033 [Xylona heveae TC161]|uniref:F-box domain-containing protein n=1 Tax=Xylona heveae (strain CBS 132557 / TC161) TaxID=1328760 RepID=A0A165AEN3_XYLHT|nr:hypothetical protein L228DRAFT_250033 [Xylona heveae TC161]KZF20352.1 hypothetical protein L228DRAFT_250033 [Xylona heveae TC161]
MAKLEVDNGNIFRKFLARSELLFELTCHLDIEDFVSLYAISKEFHYLVNLRLSTQLLSHARMNVPQSAFIFRFKAYRHLCINDPTAPQNHEASGKIRRVPSLRWLRMVHFREKVVDEIIQLLAEESHRLPPETKLTIKKIWFTMDLAHNSTRVGLMHNSSFWTDNDIFYACLFFIKLDMRFNDPIDGEGHGGLRQLMLGQRSLTTLWKALRHEDPLTPLGLMRLYVRWSYQPAPEHRHMSILGVPADQVGRGCKEGWGKGAVSLLRPDQLVVREGIRRRLDIHKRYMDMMLFGYMDNKTFHELSLSKPSEDLLFKEPLDDTFDNEGSIRHEDVIIDEH